MTVSATQARQLYACNGSTTVRSVPFKIEAEDQITVVLRTLATPDPAHDVTLALTTDYTVQNVGSANAQFTTLTAYSSAYALMVERAVPSEQDTDFIDNDILPAATLESGFDLLVEAVQSLSDKVDRSLKFDNFTLLSTYEPTMETPLDGYALIWDGTTGRMKNTSTSLATLQDQAAAIFAITADITTVAGISANVTSVAANAANINTVAASITSVNTVAAAIASVIAVASVNATDLHNVGNIAANVTTVAGISANVTTVAGISANVTTVAGIAANVTTVAGIAANVTTVAGLSSSIATVVTNITDIQDAAANAAAASASASSAATYASTASSAASSASSSASAASSSASDASGYATTASTQATNAAASAATAATVAAALVGTSTTSLAIATGAKTFTTQAGKQWAAGQFISAVSAANNANYMHGQVTSYSGTTLIINVLDIGGSGTLADWNIAVSGSQGATGAQGPSGSVPLASAGGSADAITADFSPDITLTNGQVCIVVAASANTTTTPTFAPDGLTAHTITKNGGAALAANDIAGAGHVLVLEYNLSGTRWELANPSVILPIPLTYLDTDTALAANSDTKVPSQKAIKTYVDAIVAGLSPKASVRVVATSAQTGTYSNGASGVGATFTYTATGTDTIDSVNLALNDRVALVAQSSSFQNGIYKVTTLGTGGIAGILTRATDYDTNTEIVEGSFFVVDEGTVNAGRLYILTTTGAITVGTTGLTYTNLAIAAAAAGALTGATLASNVLATSITSVGTMTGGATGAGFTIALSTSTITGTLSGTNIASSVALAGSPTTTSQSSHDNSTKIATTAYTDNAAYTIEQQSKSANYTTVLGDAGKHIYHPGADTTARTITIDSNANVAYPIGTTLTFVNDTSAGVMTIAITSDTLVLAGAGTTGSRTLAANGMATAIKMTSTRWMIAGTGLT